MSQPNLDTAKALIDTLESALKKLDAEWSEDSLEHYFCKSEMLMSILSDKLSVADIKLCLTALKNCYDPA